MAKNLEMGNLYDFNKIAYTKMPSIPADRAKEKFQDISAWFAAKPSNKYFMLLCKELADYTVFNLSKGADSTVAAIQELKDLTKHRGTLLDISYNENFNSYEFWVRAKQDGEVHMYLLFECNDFIIEV